MERKELIDLAVGFLSSDPTVHLVTLDEGSPVVRPVSNPSYHEGRILLSTTQSSSKVDHIRKDPHVCIYLFSEEKQAYCSVRGTATIVDRTNSKALAAWKDELKKYYTKGLDDSDYCFIDVEIRAVEYVDYGWEAATPAVHRGAW